MSCSGSVVASLSLSICIVFWYSLQQFSSRMISALQNASCFSRSVSWKLSCFFCFFFVFFRSDAVAVICPGMVVCVLSTGFGVVW